MYSLVLYDSKVRKLLAKRLKKISTILPMAIITLTTDFGEKDHFAGAIKGAVYCELQDVRIVDISHSVSPFNISEAAYIIQNAYSSFPKGTIHIIAKSKHIGHSTTAHECTYEISIPHHTCTRKRSILM